VFETRIPHVYIGRSRGDRQRVRKGAEYDADRNVCWHPSRGRARAPAPGQFYNGLYI